MSKVAVVGTGYVGLTTSIGLASLGHTVIGYDTNAAKINSLLQGVLPIYEPGLDDLRAEAIRSGNLQFTKNLNEAVNEAEFIFTCVPTPQDEDGSADLSYVLAAARAIGPLLATNSIVVTKSTVPVGSALRVEDAIGRSDVHVASNPEFLREGSAVYDFQHPDRIVVGARTLEVANRVVDLFSEIQCPAVVTTQAAAELIKYASNSFLAIKLSFVNDIATLCEATGANPLEVMSGIGLDTRIGTRFLQPGPGWGGSCFPKDTRALRSIAEDYGVPMPLISAAIESNDRAHKRVVDKVMDALGGSLVGKQIAVLGIAFKADTDDIRESPAVAVIERLVGRGAKVVAYDPLASDLIMEGLTRVADPYQVTQDSDLLLVLTEWASFSDLDAKRMLSTMNTSLVIDTRNILDVKTWTSAGAIFPTGKVTA